MMVLQPGCVEELDIASCLLAIVTSVNVLDPACPVNGICRDLTLIQSRANIGGTA